MPAQYIRNVIRSIPDWPKPGILFHDITPLLQDKNGLRILVDIFSSRYQNAHIDYIAGIDARGFILGAALAYELGIGFIPVRKKGKLPYTTAVEDYVLEYGTASVEIHVDACKAGDRIVLVDDLIATGGTMLAAAKLIQRMGEEVVEAAAIVGLPDLGGSCRIREQRVSLFTACDFPGH